MMRIINFILKFVSLIIGVIVGTKQIIDGANMGDILISLSLIVFVLLPDILRKLNVNFSINNETIYLVFLFFAQALGSVLDFYQRIYCYDKIMHFLSGFLTSFIGLYLLVRLKKYDKKSVAFNIIFIIFTALAVAVFWEIFEYSANAVFHGDPQKVALTGVNDTMQDIIVAFLASIMTAISYCYEEVNNKELIIKKFINDIKN